MFRRNKMNRIILRNIFFFISISLVFGDSYSINLSSDETQLFLLENTQEKISLKYEISQINGFNVETEKGVFSELSINVFMVEIFSGRGEVISPIMTRGKNSIISYIINIKKINDII